MDVNRGPQVAEVVQRALVDHGRLQGDVRVVLREDKADVVAPDRPLRDVGPVIRVHLIAGALDPALGDGLRARQPHLRLHVVGQQADQGEQGGLHTHCGQGKEEGIQ